MGLTTGSQLGAYEIIELLGKVGMGEVYRAKDKKLKREVAIKILPDEFSTERTGEFSPDGRWVVYDSNESGRYEVVVQAFPKPQGQWQVSTAGGGHPRWSADGKELYFVSSDDKLMAAAVRTSPTTFATSAPVSLFPLRIDDNITPGSGRPAYAVSRDGRFLVNQRIESSTGSPITLILNWRPKDSK